MLPWFSNTTAAAYFFVPPLFFRLLALDIVAVRAHDSWRLGRAVDEDGAADSEYAREDPAWGNGAFTKALVEGLGGLAGDKKTGRITVNMLALYISERVKDLTGGTQHPTANKPPTVRDFPVALDE